MTTSHHIINACEDFENFLIVFLAAMIADKVSLFPGDHSSRQLEFLQKNYRDCRLFSDRDVNKTELARIVPGNDTFGNIDEFLSKIPGSKTVVIAFTSGSTGNPVAVSKNWAGLIAGAQSLKQDLYGTFGDTKYGVLSTVPPQHSYGIETSLMPAVLGMADVITKRAHFPADVESGLRSLDGRRCFVTTPLHIRALLDGSLEPPHIDLTICATAPLDLDQATQFEQRFATKILEVYGCTESGFVATRWPTADHKWKLRPDMRLCNRGERTLVQAEFLREDVPLDDIITIRSKTHFELVGRSSDIVKVGGKRASLEGLRQALLKMPGVEDCKFILQPQSSKSMTPRTAVFVVAKGCTKDAIKTFLRQSLDPVLIPRQIVFLDAIPRTAVGKVSMNGLKRALALELGRP